MPDAAKSAVGLPELVKDNSEIVRLYNELATRHDELVDAVLEKLKEQAK